MTSDEFTNHPKTKKHPDPVENRKGKLLIGIPNCFGITTSRISSETTQHLLDPMTMGILPKKAPNFFRAS
ncbi:hypothetical protein [Gelidibacter mesophilus]|uniref:hypothetical protein n=1 Tax=Gelidibacter mesophilus TaxID=169050 RepID=UPI00041138BB|nr:hypothetical protein [Gelidibacter mesophilus]